MLASNKTATARQAPREGTTWILPDTHTHTHTHTHIHTHTHYTHAHTHTHRLRDYNMSPYI